MKNIVKTEGYTAFYKGIIPNVFLTSHGVIQFLLYEKIKYYFDEENEEKLSSAHHFAFGAASKIIAMVSTYPLQLVKTRLQDKQNLDPTKKYTGMIDGMRKILK
jgi:solute carrier family 25 (mitochondrial folate transporter), member 32